MKKVISLSIIGAALLLCGCFPSPVKAQSPTYTIPQTVTKQLASALACGGTVHNFNITNLGQTQHYAYITSTSTFNSMHLAIYGLDSQGNTYQISSTVNGVPGVVTATGYFPNIQVQVICSPSNATFTLSYTGTSSTSNQISGDYLTGVIDQPLLFVYNTALGPTTIGQQTPFGSSAGTLYLSTNGTIAAGSTVTLTCGGLETAPAITNTAIFPVGGTQSISIGGWPCSFLAVNLEPAGGSTGSVSIIYEFYPPGTIPSRSNYLHITGTNATPVLISQPGELRNVTVNTPAAGTISFFDLPATSCTGTPSTNVVAVITATATAPLGAIPYNLAFTQGICVKASAAMDFTLAVE